MWCIGALTEEYRHRMYALLELYARPMSPAAPVICIDEKSLQLLAHSRAPLPMNSRAHAKLDYEYVRNGTTNLFVAVEPEAGQRIVSVTERRGKVDFVAFVGDLVTNTCAKARQVHLALDNLNTHFRKCFDEVLGKRAATKLLRRVQFYYTPKHASWLNMAEIEIGILSRQCLDRRVPSRQLLQREVELGSRRATLRSAPSSGRSPVRMQIRSSVGTTFLNLRVDVLVLPDEELARLAGEAEGLGLPL
jgi:hypothetical protein